MRFAPRLGSKAPVYSTPASLRQQEQDCGASPLAPHSTFHLPEQSHECRALTLTFLNPLFGILWGSLFLHKEVGWHTEAGTALVTGYSPRPAARVIVPHSCNSP